jgi:tetratricopeptide (TPR) repeat protein
MGKAEKLFNAAEKLYNKKKYDSAIKYYKESVKNDPSYLDAWNKMGIAYDNIGKNYDAINCYKKCVEIRPNFKIGWYNIGDSYRVLNEYENAVPYYKKALAIDPTYGPANEWLGKVQNILRQRSGSNNYSNAPATSKAHIVEKVKDVQKELEAAFSKEMEAELIKMFKLGLPEKEKKRRQKAIQEAATERLNPYFKLRVQRASQGLPRGDIPDYPGLSGSNVASNQSQSKENIVENVKDVQKELKAAFSKEMEKDIMELFNLGLPENERKLRQKTIQEAATERLNPYFKLRVQRASQGLPRGNIPDYPGPSEVRNTPSVSPPQMTDDQRIEKLKKLVKVTNNMKIEQFAKVLEMSTEQVYERLIDWADQFGFKIDNDVIRFPTDSSKMDNFLQGLDNNFSQWQEKEVSKDGKIENELDFSAIDNPAPAFQPTPTPTPTPAPQASEINCPMCGAPIQAYENPCNACGGAIQWN